MHLDRPQPADRANNPGHDDGAAGAPAHLRRVVEIDPRASGRKAARTAVLFPLRCLENLRRQQGSSLAYFDSFWMVAVLTFAVAFLVLFMKRSVLRNAVTRVQSD